MLVKEKKKQWLSCLGRRARNSKFDLNGATILTVAKHTVTFKFVTREAGEDNVRRLVKTTSGGW